MGSDLASLDGAYDVAREAGLRGILNLQPNGAAWNITEARAPFVLHNDAVAVADGHVVERVNFSDWPLAAKLTEWLINLHMGFLFGLVNQIVLALIALALLVVSILGLVMWFRRGRRFAGPQGIGTLSTPLSRRSLASRSWSSSSWTPCGGLLETLARQEVPHLLRRVRSPIPRMILWVRDELQFFLRTRVNMALAAGDILDAWRERAGIALDVAAHEAVYVEEVRAVVAVAAVIEHHRVAGAMHDEERDGLVPAIHVDGVVVSAAHGGHAREDVGQVARDDRGHAAAVGVARGVDAPAVHVVGAVELIDDLRDEREVPAGAHDRVGRALPAVVDGLRVDADGLASCTRLVEA